MIVLGCIKNGVKTAPQPIPAIGQANIPKSIMVNAGHPEFTAGAGWVLENRSIVSRTDRQSSLMSWLSL